MAGEEGSSVEGSNSPSQIRHAARSEGYLLKFEQTLFGSKAARDAMRKRSYSTNDSDDLEERLWENSQRRGNQRFSITEMLLGQRSFYSINDSVVTQTVDEVSDSMENLGEDTIIMSADRGPGEQEEGISDTDGNGISSSKNIAQTDQVNSHLLDTFLSRLGSIAGIGTSRGVNRGGDEQENSGEYNTVYSDDFLMDRIYRRMNSKKKEKP